MFTLHIDLGLGQARPEDGNCDVKRHIELFYSQHLTNVRMISNIATQTFTQLDVNCHKSITNETN